MSVSEQEHSRAVLLNTLSSQMGRVIEAAAFLVLLPFILRTLGAEQYGLWVLVWAIASLLRLADFGFSASIVKFVADARGRGDDSRLQEVLATLFWIFVAEAVALLVLVGVLGALFNRLFDIPAASMAAGQQVFLLVGVAAAARLPFAMSHGVLTGHHKMWIVNAYNAAFTLIYVAAVPLVLPRWPDVRMLGLLNLLVALGPFLAAALHVKLTMPLARVNPRLFRRELAGELWTFSSAFIVIQIAVLIATRVDTLIIKSALPLSAIALYSLAMRLSEAAANFCVQGARAWAPVVAELHGAKAGERLRELWFTSTKMTVALSAPLLVGLAVLARPLIVNWVGEEYEGAAVLLQILVGAHFTAVVHQDSYNMLSMRGEQGLLARSMLAGQALNLCLSLLLVWKWGLVGVATATLLSALPFDLCVVQRRLGKREGVPLLDFYRRAMLPSVAPVMVMCAAFWAVQRVWPIHSLVGVALVELGGVMLFALLFYRWGLDARERRAVRRWGARRLRLRGDG